MISAFLDALGADGPSADRAGKMDLYGRFVGSWDLDVRQFSKDGTAERRRTGDNSFLWRGEVSADAGATWRVVTEFTARRRVA